MNTVCDSNNVCSVPAPYELRACHTDADCTEDGMTMGKCSGVYNHVTGLRYCNFEGASITCKKYKKELTECIEEYGCSPVVSTDKNVCSYIKCSTQVNRVLGCEASCRHVVDTVGRRCTIKTLREKCPTTPYWEEIVFAFSSLITAIIVVFVVYNIFSWNKKVPNIQDKTYHQIQ